jgi:primosomal protein N''
MSDASAIAIVAEQLIARIPAFFRAIGAYELKKAEGKNR